MRATWFQKFHIPDSSSRITTTKISLTISKRAFLVSQDTGFGREQTAFPITTQGGRSAHTVQTDNIQHMYAHTFQEFSDFVHVVLQVIADGRQEVIVGVQMGDYLIAIVEVVGAMVVHIVHGRLQRGGLKGEATNAFS